MIPRYLLCVLAVILLFLLLYVDDIILTASSKVLCKSIISLLASEFAMKYLGSLHYFLSIAVSSELGGLFLSQRKYATEIIERSGMSSCKPTHTPVDTSGKMSAFDSPHVTDPTLYHSLASALQFLTFTRPDISYVVQQVCLHIHDPCEAHFHALKRVIRYVQGTLHLGLHLSSSSSTSMVCYTDADWDGCPDTR